MRGEFDLGGYSEEHGLQLPEWVPGYRLTVSATNGQVVIAGNPEGLRSIAQHLLTLADEGVPAGVHVHYEPALELDDESLALVLDKRS